MLGAVLALIATPAVPQTGDHAPPNVIVLLIDDMGWTDLDVAMGDGPDATASDYYETPNMSALARRSMRFSAAYSPSPICAPSRASLLTGVSPSALGITDIEESRPGSRRFSDLYAGKRMLPPMESTELADEDVTVAELIRDRVPIDYGIAHFGKWHVGGGGPQAQGFEISDGATGNHSLSAHSPDPNPKDVFGVTGRAIAFMESQVNSRRPFFVQISHYANHVPLSAMQASIAKYRAKPVGERHRNPVYAALNENLDTSVGSLLAALDRLGIADNTYIIFVSDNGGSKNVNNPATNNAPLREGKTWNYEGGIRVPMFVYGPGIAAGISDTPVIGWDVVPTVCDLLGCVGELPAAIEGGSLLPLLQGRSSSVARPFGDELVWHFPHYLAVKNTTPNSAIRLGRYKLIRFYDSGVHELYDLATDIGETRDVSAQHPDIVSDLDRRLDAYLQRVDAPMPLPNPAFGGIR